MFKVVSAVIATAMMFTTSSVYAAEDMGLTSGLGSHQAKSNSGLGAQVGLQIKLGKERAEQKSDRLVLGIAAGPVLSFADRHSLGGNRNHVVGMVKATFKPGYSATLSMAGQPLLQRYSVLGAAENEADGKTEEEPKKKNKTAKTVGKIGIGALAVLGALTLVAAVSLSGKDLFEDVGPQT